MSNMKVIKDTSLVPMEVSTTSKVNTYYSGDSRESFLNAKINAEIERAISKENNLQDQIDYLKELGFAIKDVVGTYQDLLNYDTYYLLPKDIIIVLNDNNYITYYRWLDGQFMLLGNSGYTSDKVDALINEINETLESHAQQINNNKDNIDRLSDEVHNIVTYEEAYSILIDD